MPTEIIIFKKLKPAFSLIELVISFIIIALIITSMTPIYFKKNVSKFKVLNELAVNCSGLEPDINEEKNNCKLCIKHSTCVLCPKTCSEKEGYYLNREKCKCETCESFYKFSSQEPLCTQNKCCTRCNRSYCTGCAKGFGLENAAVENGCKLCNDNNFSAKVRSQKCQSCPLGAIASKTAVSNLHGNMHSGVCYCKNTLNEYSYFDEATKSCLICPVGYRCTGGLPADENHNCIKNQKENPLANFKTSCPGGGNITPCAQGYYQNLLGQNACNNCGIGYYCPNAVNTSPVRCPDNSTTLGVNSTNINDCICGDGFFKTILANGAFRCDPCPYGAWCKNGVKHCCPSGTYNNLLNQSSESACKQCGCYSHSASCASSCVSCQNAQYAPLGTSTSIGCKNCPANSHITGYGCQIADCACNVGYFKKDGKCKKCSDYFGSCCNVCNGSGCLGVKDASKQTILSNKCCRPPKKEDCSENQKFIKEDKGAACVDTQTHGSGVNGITNKEFPDESSCNNSNKACCWNGYSIAKPWIRTSIVYFCSPDPDVVSYTACSRKVCTRAAAQMMCSKVGWDFPTYKELLKLKDVQNTGNFCSTFKKTNAYLTGPLKYGYCPGNNGDKVDYEGNKYNGKPCIVNGERKACRPGYIFYGNKGQNIFHLDGDNVSHNTTPKTSSETGATSTGHVRCARRWVCD